MTSIEKSFIISSTISHKKLDLLTHDSNVIIKVLEDKLRQSFEDVNVKLVDCPDLTQEPFNLAAPGLCGKTAIIDLGGTSSSLFPDKIYVIEYIIKSLDPDYTTPFIFGDGFSLHPSNSDLCELIMNVSFSSINSKWKKNNRNCRVHSFSESKCQSHILTEYRPHCIKQGTFFLCEGLTEPVIEVYAKNYRCGHQGHVTKFVDLMRDALMQGFQNCTENIVALGGVYITKNAMWQHELIPNIEFEQEFDKEYIPRKDRCTVEMPATRIAIFNNNATTHIPTSQNSIELQTCQTSRCLSHHSSAEFNCSRYDNTDIEYLGYFSPVKTLYRVDEPTDK